MNDLPKTDNIKQPAVTVFGVENDVKQNVVQPDVIAQPNPHTVVADGKDITQPANKVRDKAIESRQAVISAVGDDKAKKIQDVKKISHSERLEELKKCTTAGAKIIIGAVSLVFVGAGLMAVVKNAGNIFHAVDGIFESVSTALANIAGRLTSKQSKQQSNVIGSVINEMKSRLCSDDLKKDDTMKFLKSAGGNLCKNVDLSKLCDVAKKASDLNEKFGINSYDQNALAGLKTQLNPCATKQKPNCMKYVGVINEIKNKYLANECLEAVAASEIGNVTKLLDDKDLVKNGILYELITNASNIAGFFTQAKNIIMCALIAIGIPAAGIFSKTFLNVIKSVYSFFKK